MIGQAGPGHRQPVRGQRERGLPGDRAPGGRARLPRRLLHRGPARLAGLGAPAGRVPAGHRRADQAPVYHGDFTTAGGRRVAERILAAGRVPRAVVCANDQTAIGVMAALQQAGLSVPGDVAVTGFDGIRLGRHLRPSLTTVVQPMAALGDTAVAMLNDRIGGAAARELPRRTVELPVRLELRGSCGWFRASRHLRGMTKEASDGQNPEIRVGLRPGGRGRAAGPGDGPGGLGPSGSGLRDRGRRVRRAELVPAGQPAGRSRGTPGSSTARTWTRRPACRWTTSPSPEVRPPRPATGGTPPRPTSGCTCGPWSRPGTSA